MSLGPGGISTIDEVRFSSNQPVGVVLGQSLEIVPAGIVIDAHRRKPGGIAENPGMLDGVDAVER